MADFSPASVEVAVLVAGALIYALIWFATRNLSRVAQILARVVPLGLVVPVMSYVSGTTSKHATAPYVESQAPPVQQQARRDGPGDTAEAERQRAAEAEAQRRAAEEARARQSAEVPTARPTAPSPPGAEPAPVAPPPTSRSAEAPKARSARPEPPTGGSGAPSPAPPPGVPAQPESDWDVVPVFYGTDRVHKDEPKRITYTADRASRLELGHALVTVPKSHQVPNIERPFAIRVPFINVTIYEQAEDPKQHFTIRELKALTRDEFIELARKRIGGSTSYKDQAVVFEHLAANIKQYGRGVTLYCSSNDRAMAAARRVAGGIPRAGDVPSDGPIVLAGIDTIDISQTSTDYLALNHSSYAEKSALLADISLLLQTGERPPETRIPILQRITTPNGDFWRYPLIPR